MRRSLPRWIVLWVSGVAIILLAATFALNFLWAASLIRFSPNQSASALVVRGGVMFAVTPKVYPWPQSILGTRFSLQPRTPRREGTYFGLVEWWPYGSVDANGWVLYLPFWFLALPFVGTAYLGWKRSIPDSLKCRNCKYSVNGLHAPVCPECGAAVNISPASASAASTPPPSRSSKDRGRTHCSKSRSGTGKCSSSMLDSVGLIGFRNVRHRR